MDQNKRTKVMLLIVLLLALFVVFTSGKKGKGTSSSGGGLMAKLSGVDIAQKEQEFRNAKNARDLAMMTKEQFLALSEKIDTEKVNFWQYNKAGSPRGEAQQKIISTAKGMGIEDVRVSIGFERNVPSCSYLKMIDFSVTSRSFTMKNIADFMAAIDNDTKKFYWGDCKIYHSGKSLSFSANIRIYVLNKKAVDLLGKK